MCGQDWKKTIREGQGGHSPFTGTKILKGVIRNAFINYRIIWVDCRSGEDKYASMCAYAPVSRETKIGKAEMKKIWKQLDEHIKNFDVGRKADVLWDMNAKYGDEKVEIIVGGWGVPDVNANCEFLVDFLCRERDVCSWQIAVSIMS